ncbi:MAG: Na+/H+ antiporter subunit E [Desulfobacterales bacterium]|nr:Na+/H+ antiporter subunit E [Desulfobacterales bacterium]
MRVRQTTEETPQPPARPPFWKEKLRAPFFLTFLVSFATWIVLSGKFDPFHLSLGGISCFIVAWFSGDMLFSPTGLKTLPGVWIRFILYIPWLIYQIFVANMHVMKLVFHPRMMALIDPKIIRFKSRLTSDMALFVFANSITLTPGTITVFVSVTGIFTVHVIDEPSGSALPGEMEERVAKIFGE